MEVKTYSIDSYQKNTIAQLKAIFDNAADWDNVSEETKSVTYTYGNAALKFSYNSSSLSMSHEISTGSISNSCGGGDSSSQYVGVIVCKTTSSLAVIIQNHLETNGLPNTNFTNSNRIMFVLTKNRNAITGAEEKGIVNVKYYNADMNSINVSSAEDQNIFYERYSLNSNAVKTVLYDATTKNSQCYSPHVFIPKYSNVGEANAIVEIGSKTYYMMAGGLYVLDD